MKVSISSNLFAKAISPKWIKLASSLNQCLIGMVETPIHWRIEEGAGLPVASLNGPGYAIMLVTNEHKMLPIPIVLFMTKFEAPGNSKDIVIEYRGRPIQVRSSPAMSSYEYEYPVITKKMKLSFLKLVENMRVLRREPSFLRLI